MADYNTPAFTWVIESTSTDATTIRTTIESDGVNPPSFTVAMQTLGSDKWLSGDWLAPKVTMDPPWDEPTHFCHECGQEFSIDEAGVANHVDPSSPTGIDHDADEDHVPYELEHDESDDEADYEACFCDFDPAGAEHDRSDCLADVDPVELAWHERTRHDRPR